MMFSTRVLRAHLCGVVLAACRDEDASFPDGTSTTQTRVTSSSGIDPATSDVSTATFSAESGPTSETGANGSEASGTASDVAAGPCDRYSRVAHSLSALSQLDLDDVAGVQCVEYGVRLWAAESSPITDLSPLSDLHVVGGTFAIYQFQEPDLSGLNSLEQIGEVLRLGGPTVDGAPGCSPNTGLVTLHGVEGLARIEGLEVCGLDGQGNAAAPLQSIAALDAALVGELGVVSLLHLAALDSIDALAGVTRLDGLALVDLPQLTDLAPLAELTRMTSMTVWLTGVTDLHGLESVAEVDAILDISFNDQLVTLDGLDALASVGALYITNNAMLPQTEAEAFAATIDVAAEVVICGNLDGEPCA